MINSAKTSFSFFPSFTARSLILLTSFAGNSTLIFIVPILLEAGLFTSKTLAAMANKRLGTNSDSKVPLALGKTLTVQ